MTNPNSTEKKLKEACQLTGASWAACVERNNSGWTIENAYRLSKKRKSWVHDYLSQSDVDRWLCGGLAGGRSRSRKLPKNGIAEADRLYTYALEENEKILIVAGGEFTKNDKKVWRLLSSSGVFGVKDTALQPADAFIFGGHSSAPYDLHSSLKRILARILHYIPAKAAWLAIYGQNSLKIEAQKNIPDLYRKELFFKKESLLVQMKESASPILIEKADLQWKRVHEEIAPLSAVAWCVLPLMIGQRLIGAVSLWRDESFSEDEWIKLQRFSHYAATSVEMYVTFSEMADHLKRQAMLNDFALIISSAQNLDQIVRRVFALLTRTFKTELISLFLLSSDGRTLREYRNIERRLTPRTEFLDSHPIAGFVRAGKNVRIENASTQEYLLANPSAQAALTIPLKYRGEVIGVLALESEDVGAFSGYDENLLVVIASHLAGLVEYGRLRDEAEARARNLGLIHEVVQQVIGVTNVDEVAQITANLLVQHFSYELAAVMLVDHQQHLRVKGISGAAPSLVEIVLKKFEDPTQGGITGYVFASGESLMIDDASKDPNYQHIPGWDIGSEICVALREGDRIWGIINVEARAKNAFTHNDLLALESLAGFLTSAVSSVDRYQMLQDTIQILQTTQEELQERMEAQHNAENRLIQAAKLAAVGEMAAGVAHELNNPLTTVAGFAELVLDDLPPESPQRTDLELVLREATRARNVVRRLLDFARQSESVRVRSDLNEVIEDVAALTKHLFETNAIKFKMTLAEKLPWVLMDRDQIKQVVLNLLHNALHAMPKGGKLSVHTETRQKNDECWVVMSVQDNGKGISPHDLARIFEPFFTTKADDGGTGLGLAVSYGIITDHHGFIDVDSTPTKGACFSVWLPLEDKPE
ncbi:MAG: GAF domain-containing protein [Anaerolineae bacterium]|nr:GAF domain-containing protein [Anaerolineae bacterium]MBT7990918.1 GAF domain-containing protein [Anaerolineae bacterium]